MSSGLVRVGYLHFAFLGAESGWAAEASECAAEQEAFWEYHDLLYASQNGENRGAFTKNNLKQFAAELGLDSKAFDSCLDSGKYEAAIAQQSGMMSSLGVRSTPTFLINGQPMVGAQSFSAFQQIIESLLAR